MTCARCGGPTLTEADGETYCILCGEYAHQTPPPPELHQGRPGVRSSQWWEPELKLKEERG